ncbi:sulfurtransferase TusA family protein [Ureibacillus chungkukjangi]|uniref:sulfurtransferase TusA family protein n=1 Tax=Ureibacillus chungkukjangi TaxID=1202712 RepID=UPI00203F3FAC|nr:sulfurtransferase TusA family protein [Ureibacillus chungkukjangi]MCM3386913.1 sulfurtransferase TusA family protein [Ureibacillus chungkukjangi]
MAIKADVHLDAKGFACPMPIVKTKKAMNNLSEGQVLEVQATDKGSLADLKAWAESVGHQYIGTVDEKDVLFHYLRKSSNDEVEGKTYEQMISNEEILERVSNGSIILDVREEAEYAFGHIEGSKSIPMGELEKRLIELDKDKEILVICRTGVRSGLAAQKLADKGFAKVVNVLPGMNSWNGNLSKKI